MTEHTFDQDFVSQQIREVFPDVPERCITCPALYNAAAFLLGEEALAVGVALHPENPENPLADPEVIDTERGTSVANAADFVADTHQRTTETVRETAEELWTNCSSGTQVLAGEGKRREQKGTTRTNVCASMSIHSRFVAPMHVTVHTAD